jgi:hypothetical protein
MMGTAIRYDVCPPYVATPRASPPFLDASCDGGANIRAARCCAATMICSPHGAHHRDRSARQAMADFVGIRTHTPPNSSLLPQRVLTDSREHAIHFSLGTPRIRGR